MDEFENNHERSSTTNISENIPSGFSMSTILSLKDVENKRDVNRGKDCMKKLCELLREHTTKLINFFEKILKLLRNEQQ